MRQYYPPHCIGYEAGDIPEGYSIPCRRGTWDGHAGLLRMISVSIGNLLVLIIAPLIILVTMTMMFRSVAKTEKKMQKYGVRVLRNRASMINFSDQQDARGFAGNMKKLGQCLCLIADDSQTNHRFAICCLRCPCLGNADCDDPERPPRSTTKSNKMTSQKRAVLHMALGYAGAWLLVWSVYFIYTISFFLSLLVGGSQVSTGLLPSITLPLQGSFNFLVLMAPKVRTT